MNEKSIKIRPILSQMEIGDKAEFPIIKMKSVRAQASELGAILNRKYETRSDREKRIIIVKRLV